MINDSVYWFPADSFWKSAGNSQASIHYVELINHYINMLAIIY